MYVLFQSCIFSLDFRDGIITLLAGLLYLDHIISTINLIAMKSGIDTHVTQRMHLMDFGDPLTFHLEPLTDQHLKKLLFIIKYPAKLMIFPSAVLCASC